ncbi:hypothetical protein SHIRM173S_07929 [Streptomyces hirsutus]
MKLRAPSATSATTSVRSRSSGGPCEPAERHCGRPCVTLGYLGATQIAQGAVEEACATWTSVLDAMEDGIHSGRARRTVVDIRHLLSPYRKRGIRAVTALDARAATCLAQVD